MQTRKGERDGGVVVKEKVVKRINLLLKQVNRLRDMLGVDTNDIN
jgi:hypothetical protein